MSISTIAVFQTEHYQNHNQKRLAHLASLDLDIAGTTVLNLRVGIGDHTGFLLDRGCQVVSGKAREEHLGVLRSRYPHVQTLTLDLDNLIDNLEKSFDIIYCHGLLYHLAKPAEALAFMAQHCRHLLLLETCVSFGQDVAVNICAQDAQDPTQSFSGHGCRLTRPWIYDQLKQHFEFVYLPTTQPQHAEFPLDWTTPLASQPLTRSIFTGFIGSRSNLRNPLLREEIPMQQAWHSFGCGL